MMDVGLADWGTRAAAERSLTDCVAHFAADLRVDDLPATVIRKVQLHLLDTLGCAAGGAGIDLAESARQAAHAIGSHGSCRVFGSDAAFSSVAATFANATIANALDFDDGTEVEGKGLGHPGASLVSAALAGVGRFDVDGPTLLRALAAGYEINNRLIVAVQPSAGRFDEVYGIAQHQAIGAAIVFGVLAGFDAPRLHNAIGLAATLTSVPSLHKYNWRDRPIVSFKDGVAPAAMAGVQAVELTFAGFRGSVDVLDGPQGYWRMIGSDQFDAMRVVDALGSTWRTLDSSFKLYPACRWLAPALEAFERLCDEHALDARQIVSVQVASFGKIGKDLMERRPVNAVDAQFSLPFLFGALATRRPVGAAWFASDAFADAEVLRIADCVHAHTDPAMDAAMRGDRRRPSATVIIGLVDGRTLSLHIDAPHGGRLRPVEEERIIEKARANLAQGGANVDAVIGAVEGLPSEGKPLNQLRLMTGIDAW